MTDIFLPSPLICGTGARAGFSTRREEGIRQIGIAAGFDASKLFMVTQVHGKKVVLVGASDRPADVGTMEADGLTTSRPGITLAVRTADCVPVLLSAPRGVTVAAVHAGWRGLVAGILAEGVSAVAAEGGCETRDVVGSIGPAIGPCCFEVGEDVAECIVESVASPDVVSRPAGALKPFVDLREAARLHLIAAGMLPGRIDLVGPCTRCSEALLHSYRRDGPKSGRQLAFITPAG